MKAKYERLMEILRDLRGWCGGSRVPTFSSWWKQWVAIPGGLVAFVVGILCFLDYVLGQGLAFLECSLPEGKLRARLKENRKAMTLTPKAVKRFQKWSVSCEGDEAPLAEECEEWILDLGPIQKPVDYLCSAACTPWYLVLAVYSTIAGPIMLAWKLLKGIWGGIVSFFKDLFGPVVPEEETEEVVVEDETKKSSSGLLKVLVLAAIIAAGALGLSFVGELSWKALAIIAVIAELGWRIWVVAAVKQLKEELLEGLPVRVTHQAKEEIAVLEEAGPMEDSDAWMTSSEEAATDSYLTACAASAAKTSVPTSSNEITVTVVKGIAEASETAKVWTHTALKKLDLKGLQSVAEGFSVSIEKEDGAEKAKTPLRKEIWAVVNK